jgi:hypothetical protein
MSNTSGKAKINATRSRPTSASEVRRQMTEAHSRGVLPGATAATDGRVKAEAAWSRVIGTKKP